MEPREIDDLFIPKEARSQEPTSPEVVITLKPCGRLRGVKFTAGVDGMDVRIVVEGE